jgi:hypothetical protein
MLSMLFLLPTFLMRGTISNWLQRRQDNGTKTVYGDGLWGRSIFNALFGDMLADAAQRIG